MKRAEAIFAKEKLKVLLVGFQDRQSKIREYAGKQGVMSDVGYDEKDLLARKFGIKYGAGVVIINAQGIVKKRLSKGFSGQALTDAIQKALAMKRA